MQSFEIIHKLVITLSQVMTPVVRNKLLLTVDHAHSRLCFNVPGTALIFQTAALCSRTITQDFQTEDSSIRGM